VVGLTGDARTAAVHLSCAGLPTAQLLALLARTGDPVRALASAGRGDAARPARTGPGRPAAAAAARRAELGLAELDRIGAQVYAFGCDGYPERLGELHDPPPIVYLAGSTELLQRRVVAVVGARRHTEYGAEAARWLAAGLSAAGVVVASGLARGIDGVAHEAALAGGTIAVLGCGIDVPYPREHERLYERILAAGLLVSEFAPGEPALRHHFPQRNRILAALAEAIVVVEAGARSGALITVDHALDLGRDVFAVPGPIGRETSAGTNALLKDGARVATSAADVLDVLGVRPARVAAEPAAETPAGSVPMVAGEGARVLGVLGEEPRHLDEIGRVAGLGTGPALAGLLELELAGSVRQWPGMRFSLTAVAALAVRGDTAPSAATGNRSPFPG
jgi:DNA processing protein